MTDALREQLQSTLGAAYRIDRELAGGGMSRVFVAHEAQLDRDVVVKVISPELAEGVDAKRFAREIRLAAKLQQANIVPVISAGLTSAVVTGSDGTTTIPLPYYTMPYVDGLSLRARLATAGPLPFAEIVGVLRDIARALAFAHQRGIVHRDMKPDNVLLSGGTAMVTDFGLGKALTSARGQGWTVTRERRRSEATAAQQPGKPEHLTFVGMTVGTPGYMSPEQATADPTSDHRADIYSLGVIAYEMLTGGNPFLAKGGQREILQAQVSEMPAPLEKFRPDCPPALAALVTRCLAKDPADRPQSAQAMLQELDAITVSSSSQMRIPAVRRRRRLVLAALGVVVFAAGVAAALLVRQGPGALRGAARRGAEAGAGDQLVAVLPFDDIGGDTANAYFADGMADELATQLSKMRGLRVVARSSAMAYRGQHVDAREIGRKLGAGIVIGGSVRRDRGRVRLSAQLTEAKDGLVLWSETYERPDSDVFAIQEEISRAIVQALAPRLTSAGSGAPAAPAPARTTAAAYDLYLRGRHHLSRRGVWLDSAARFFTAALAIDSTYAPAWAALSTAYYYLPYYTFTPTREIAARARRAAERAVAYAPSSGDAHLALALSHQLAFDWGRADAAFRRAMELEPTNGFARYQYARQLAYEGRIAESVAELERARALDPMSAVVALWLARAMSMAGRHPEAVAEARRALELDPTLPPVQSYAALAFLAAGRAEDARAQARRSAASPLSLGIIAHVLGAAGDTAGARAMVRDLEAKRGREWLAESNLAYAYLGLRDTARALDALERAAEAGEHLPVNIAFADYVYDPVRGAPRFLALVRRFGLEERIAMDARGGRP